MNELRCIVIEDEPLAKEILEEYIADISFLKLIATFRDALSAQQLLRTSTIDVVFLDLHLPKLKGFDFLKTLTVKPQVIVTTAYHQYAVQGYELEVVDYLIKPISFKRFVQATNKLKMHQPIEHVEEHKASQDFMFLNVNKKHVKVKFDDILFIESQKDYIKLYLETETLSTKMQLGQVMTRLPENQFSRVHRSFVVNVEKIKAYSSTFVELESRSIPIGRSYKGFLKNNL